MSDVVLFHHVQGLTDGVLDLAARLRAGGHTVHTPDLFDGATAATVEEGFALMKAIGDDVLDTRLEQVLADLPASDGVDGAGLVYAGISYGVMIAQRLAQQTPGARGALLYEACVSLTAEWAFGSWPHGVPVQVHGAADDPFFALEGDLEAARELVDVVEATSPGTAELFVYPGDVHLFTDNSLPGYDAAATDLVVERSLALLDRLS